MLWPLYGTDSDGLSACALDLNATRAPIMSNLAYPWSMASILTVPSFRHNKDVRTGEQLTRLPSEPR